MRKLTLCARCMEKMSRSGLVVEWEAPPGMVKKQQCLECRRKTYCGVAVVGTGGRR